MMDTQEWYDEELALARSILRNLSNEELEKAARDALEEARYHMLRLGEEESPFRWLYMFLNSDEEPIFLDLCVWVRAIKDERASRVPERHEIHDIGG
jgi:hypothetical protein